MFRISESASIYQVAMARSGVDDSLSALTKRPRVSRLSNICLSLAA